MTNTPTPRPNMEGIEARVKAAFDGPLFAHEDDLIGGWAVMNVDKPPSKANFQAGDAEIASFTNEADAKFIAHAYQDVPELCNYIKTLEEAEEIRMNNRYKPPIAHSNNKVHWIVAFMRCERVAQNLTHQALEDISNISRGSIGQYETGNTKFTSLHRLEKLLNVLGYELVIRSKNKEEEGNDITQRSN